MLFSLCLSCTFVQTLKVSKILQTNKVLIPNDVLGFYKAFYNFSLICKHYSCGVSIVCRKLAAVTTTLHTVHGPNMVKTLQTNVVLIPNVVLGVFKSLYNFYLICKHYRCGVSIVCRKLTAVTTTLQQCSRSKHGQNTSN